MNRAELILKIAYWSAITLAAILKTRSARRLARCLLPAFLCAHIFIKRETSGYEAVSIRYALGTRRLFRQIPFLFVLIPNIYTMHHGEMETMCQFITTYSQLCTSCSWIKKLISAASVSSQDLKETTMLLVVYFLPFLLFCHQTGQYIVRITERTLYYPPIFYLRRVQIPGSRELFSKNQIPGSQKF